VRTVLEGVERFTVELAGRADPAIVAALPPGVEAERESDDGAVPVNVLFFRMEGLRPQALPGPRFDYCEALFRVGVRHRGAPAWLAVACDIDNALVRATGERLIRYPVRSARLAIDATRVTVEAPEGTLSAVVEETAEQATAAPPRIALTRHRETLYRIPWEEVDPTHRYVAQVRIVDDTLSENSFGVPVRYAERAVSMQGRIHRCGLATPV
jgi:hypothetical protein